jgi:E3 ubiquitin-protein ligase RNF139
MKMLVLVDVLLRVPPLFIMDELLRIGIGLPQGDSNRYNSSSEIHDVDASITEEEVIPTISVFSDSEVQHHAQFYKVVVVTVLKYILSYLGKLSLLV